MAVILSDMQQKDGTHYSTECLEVRKYTVDFKIRVCEILMLYIKTFMYIQVLC